MKEVLKKIWKVIKTFWGIIFSLCAIASVGLLFDKEASGATIPALLLIGICGYLAYVCFKKPKKPEPVIRNVYDNKEDFKKGLPLKSKKATKPSNNAMLYTTEQAKNYLRIVEDCLTLIETTSNLDVFFMRRDLGFETIRKLKNTIELESILNLEKAFTGTSIEQKREILLRSYQKEDNEISKLKTDTAKKRHWKAYLDLLLKYEDEYQHDWYDEYSNLVNEIQQYIAPTVVPTYNDAGATYIFDERDKFVGRSDGKLLTEEDSVYLSQICLEKALKKDAEIKSRGLTTNIITDEPLNDNEVLFFNAFSEKLLEAKLNPGYVSIERLGSGTLNVTYYSIYVGKIFLAETDTICKYRVMKIGNTRATRIFDDRKSAEHYIKDKVDYYVEEHKTHISSHMQCLIGDYDVANLDNIDVDTAINTIPKWIKYIKRSMRDSL